MQQLPQVNLGIEPPKETPLRGRPLPEGSLLASRFQEAIAQIIDGHRARQEVSGGPLAFSEAPVDASGCEVGASSPLPQETASAGFRTEDMTAEDATTAKEALLYSRLNDITAECQATKQRLHQQQAATKEAHQKYLEHRDKASVEQKLLDERQASRKLEADKKNLAGLLDHERQRAEQQTQMFRHNLKGMGDLQRNLTEELAEARERVSAVKRAYRQKVGELQKEHEEWRVVIENHEQIVKMEEERAVVDRLRRQMDQLQIFANDLATEKEETHEQLRQQMRLNEQLQSELTELTERFMLQEQRRKQQQQMWRRDHLHAVDKKLEARDFARCFVEAAVQADVDSCVSEEASEMASRAHSTKAFPRAAGTKG
ncbi:hypothetical protein cyc_05729 [Cyclospora cayetanensis]|uniref:Uncharacterized protein n=1 Tax=Cyclospora cayetanensis TaxID=88456 RepID=A0A1D3CWB4_9EIME|nr:hypothetical protein cyc_05729 [Cyclospora cayetanensis]